jgi:hypothetical protein
MKWSKKASMSLSINAIVILVLAMAILGLGIGIVNMVKNRAGDLDGLYQIDVAETADSAKRIANIKDTLELRANRDNDMIISFYNTKSECESAGAEMNISCSGTAATDVGLDFTYLQAPAKIDQGTADKLISRIKPYSTDEVDIKGSYACEFQVVCSGAVAERKSIILDIIA